MSVYAISDLHGEKELFDAVKKFLKSYDIVYCLGDCADRGDNGFQIIKEVLSDKRFIYLKGNHEQLLSNAILEQFSDHSSGNAILLLAYNGGEKTFNDWIQDGMKREYAGILRRLPEKAIYNNTSGFTVILTHAGFTPGVEERSFIWDRDHFFEKWQPGYEKTICVHGHTPIPYFIKNIQDGNSWDGGALWYCGNHKVNIDCGSSTTKRTILLDLDTFDEHIFDVFSGTEEFEI